MEGKKDERMTGSVCVDQRLGGWGGGVDGWLAEGGEGGSGGVSLGFKDLACSPIFHTTVTS